MQPLRFKLRLFAAIVVAALFTQITDPAAYRRIWRAITLWWGAMDKGARLDDASAWARMGVCESCPIFYRPLQTCGSPLKDRDIGCWCFMPAASKLADKGCWLDETMGDEAPHGWKKAGLK